MTAQTHTVLRGENLSIIAKNYSVDIDELTKENGIEKNGILSVKQKLKIPEKKIRVTPDAKPSTSAECSVFGCVVDDFFSSASKENVVAVGKRLVPDWLDEMLSKLRATDANENMQQKEKSSLTKDNKPANHTPKVAKKKGSKGTSKIEEVKNGMRNLLGKEAQEVTVNGVKLTENEKRQIIASVALCEMNGDGYGSINADQEFVGNMGDVSYAHIVHLGLSYGLIQYVQDLGPLGDVLKKMYEKDSAQFIKIFGGGDEAIAKSLIVLTTTGHPNFVGKKGAHPSGLAYWASIRKTDLGKKLKKEATTDSDGDKKSDLAVEKEIRGVRVHPLIPKQGEPAIDIWKGVWKERFLEAGKVAAFQEVQLDMAVKNYLNKVLSLAKEMKVRSALALAFLTACKVRGAEMKLLNDVADDLGIKVPFKTNADERKCIEAIAKATGDAKKVKIGKVQFSAHEAHRAKLLVKDDLRFLVDDYYDLSTYI